MNIKNLKYMQGDEFKQRQSSFGFFCQKALETLTEFVKQCRAGWFEVFHRTEKTINNTLPLFWETKYHGRKTLESWNGYRLMSGF